MVYFKEIEYSLLWVLFNSITIVFMVFDKSKRLNKYKFWSIVAIIPVNFSQLHYMVHTIRPNDLDTFLIKIDYFIFGIHPTLWLEKITVPWLTEILQIVYSTFYFLPIILIVILFLKKKEEELNLVAFQVVLGFYISYLVYFIVPAIGPRFTLAHLQSFPLTGIWVMEDIQFFLNKLEQIQRDAFPSGHTAITVLTLFYAKKSAKNYYYIMLPITILMVFSTVYLRYHYVIDVFAGFILFFCLIFFGPKIFKKLELKTDKMYPHQNEVI